MADRLLLGKYNDGVTYGMKLSIPGVSVLTASPEQLIFDTQWAGAGAIHATGTSTVGSTVAFTALSFRPIAFVVAYNGSGHTIDPFWTSNSPDTYRWSTSYTTKEAAGVPYTITSSSITFLSIPSGFTGHYTYLRYIIYRIPGS